VPVGTLFDQAPDAEGDAEANVRAALVAAGRAPACSIGRTSGPPKRRSRWNRENRSCPTKRCSSITSFITATSRRVLFDCEEVLPSAALAGRQLSSHALDARLPRRRSRSKPTSAWKTIYQTVPSPMGNGTIRLPPRPRPVSLVDISPMRAPRPREPRTESAHGRRPPRGSR